MKFDERGRPRTRGPSLDHLPRIDSMEWHREGWFSWPWLRLSWGDFAAIKCKPGDSSDILADVLLPSGHFGATIGVDQEKRPLGGFLRWFRCPGCGGRCRYLYLLPARVICRICSRLPYESERVSDFGRLDLRRRKARDRLAWDDGLPVRRKWQRVEAFERDLWEFERLDDEHLMAGVARFAR